jgi:hypothetical protein
LPKLGITLFGLRLEFDNLVNVPRQLRFGNHLEHLGLQVSLTQGQWIHKNCLVQFFSIVLKVQTLHRIPDLTEQAIA